MFLLSILYIRFNNVVILLVYYYIGRTARKEIRIKGKVILVQVAMRRNLQLFTTQCAVYCIMRNTVNIVKLNVTLDRLLQDIQNSFKVKSAISYTSFIFQLIL